MKHKELVPAIQNYLKSDQYLARETAFLSLDNIVPETVNDIVAACSDGGLDALNVFIQRHCAGAHTLSGMDKLFVLKKVSFFSKLKEASLITIASGMKECEYTAGETIGKQQGTAGYALYVIASGGGEMRGKDILH